MSELPANPFYKPYLLPLLALVFFASVAVFLHFVPPNREPAPVTKGQAAEQKPPRPAGGNARAGAPVTVQTGLAQLRDLAVVESGLGTVVPAAEVLVQARVSGRLEKILFAEGQWVQKGELLAQLDGRPFAADLVQVEGQAARNRALMANAQADLVRFTSLGQQTAISAQQIDAQKSLVEQYRGLVQADQGAVEKARLQLEFTQIRAPISGRIGLRRVDPGNNISAQAPEGLALITEVNPIHVVFALPGELAGELAAQLHSAQAQKRSLTVEAWDKANKTRLSLGELLSLDNQIDTSTGAIKLKARFNNDSGQLFANQFVNVRMQIQQLSQALVVPTRAILRGSEGPFVYALSQADGATEQDRAKLSDRSYGSAHANRTKPGDGAKPSADTKLSASPKQAEAGNPTASAVKKDPNTGPIAAVKPVTVGVSQGEYTQIASGLQAGDEVVISGADRLREGIQVRVANAAPPISGPTGAALTDAQAEVPPKARAF